MASLTQERLKELLSYDAETGELRWRSSRGRVAAGSLAGCVCDDGYIRVGCDGTLYLAHRLVWLYVTGTMPPEILDHKNRNKSDNRWANLRACTKSENGQNTVGHADAKTPFKGVSLTTSNRWAARICVRRVSLHLGNYDTPEQAAAAYDTAARKLHGEYAKLNEVA